MVGRRWAAWGVVAGIGIGLGCGGADHQRGASGGASGLAGAPGSGTGGAPVASGGAAGTAVGTGGAAGATMSPSTFLSPGASIAPGSLCEADGWCWYDPRPSGDVWRAVAGAGAAEILDRRRLEDAAPLRSGRVERADLAALQHRRELGGRRQRRLVRRDQPDRDRGHRALGRPGDHADGRVRQRRAQRRLGERPRRRLRGRLWHRATLGRPDLVDRRGCARHRRLRQRSRRRLDRL